jgi:hypothetical protein
MENRGPLVSFLTTLLGQLVVDLHQLCLHYYIYERKKKRDLFAISSIDDEMELLYKK